MITKETKIVIPGAAGLVGQNLIVLLKERGYSNIVAIDKHAENTQTLKQLHPDIQIIDADLSENGAWQNSLENADVIVMLQAQIGAKDKIQFIKNNLVSTQVIIESAKKHKVPYIIHVSSSVVESVADDDYTNTKKEQEQVVAHCGISYCVLRPTLMFGWFDRKHLGWLSRFMKRIPIFPIPGDGKYMRQPLYVKDFCKIIISCLEKRPNNQVFNITGREQIDYVDIIKSIKKTLGLRTWIVHIPYQLFYWLLKIYARFDKNPPFTVDQLKALIARDQFELIPWWDIFNVESTPFQDAVKETFTDPAYCKHILKF